MPLPLFFIGVAAATGSVGVGKSIKAGIDASLRFEAVASPKAESYFPLPLRERRVRIGWSGTPFVI